MLRLTPDNVSWKAVGCVNFFVNPSACDPDLLRSLKGGFLISEQKRNKQVQPYNHRHIYRKQQQIWQRKQHQTLVWSMYMTTQAASNSGVENVHDNASSIKLWCGVCTWQRKQHQTLVWSMYNYNSITNESHSNDSFPTSPYPYVGWLQNAPPPPPNHQPLLNHSIHLTDWSSVKTCLMTNSV